LTIDSPEQVMEVACSPMSPCLLRLTEPAEKRSSGGLFLEDPVRARDWL